MILTLIESSDFAKSKVCFNLVDDSESYSFNSGADVIPEVLPIGHAHPSQVAQMLRWNTDDHARGPDFNVGSIARM